MESPIHSQMVKSTGDDMSLGLASEVEGSFVELSPEPVESNVTSG